MGRRERAVGGSSRTVAAHARTPVKWVGAHRDLARLAAEAPRDLPRGEWKDFLDEFSVEREGWQTEMRVFQPDQTSRIEIRGLPLEGISIDLEPTEATTLITVGKETFDHLTHTIPRTTRVTLLNESELEIESADRGRTLVRCSPP